MVAVKCNRRCWNSSLRHSYINQKSMEIRASCTRLWQALQSVIRFCSMSSPDRLRNSWWWTSRFDILPQNWHLHPSRHTRSWSYFSALSRKRGAFNQIRFTSYLFVYALQKSTLLVTGQKFEEL